jgi:nucleoside-diphosphate-sugar epimerase
LIINKITVIGGSGFVGTNLCRYLVDKDLDFEIIDLKKSKQFPNKSKIGDVRSLESLRNNVTGDIVVNLAAVHRDDIKDIDEYYLTNVVGAQNISSICEEKNIKKIIFTSTVAVYGFAKPGTDEGGEINPFNEYGRTKFKAEEVFRSWQDTNNTSLIIIRPTVIFGEGNRGNVFNLLNQIAKGNFFIVGDGNNKKSMAYILNVVAFIESCISFNTSYQVFNYIDLPDLSMNELVSKVNFKINGKVAIGPRIPYFLGLSLGYIADFISKVFSKKLTISSIRVKKFTSTTTFYSTNAKEINFVPTYTLEEGLNRTIDREFLNVDKNQEIFFSE